MAAKLRRGSSDAPVQSFEPGRAAQVQVCIIDEPPRRVAIELRFGGGNVRDGQERNGGYSGDEV